MFGFNPTKFEATPKYNEPHSSYKSSNGRQEAKSHTSSSTRQRTNKEAIGKNLSKKQCLPLDSKFPQSTYTINNPFATQLQNPSLDKNDTKEGKITSTFPKSPDKIENTTQESIANQSKMSEMASKSTILFRPNGQQDHQLSTLQKENVEENLEVAYQYENKASNEMFDDIEDECELIESISEIKKDPSLNSLDNEHPQEEFSGETNINVSSAVNMWTPPNSATSLSASCPLTVNGLSFNQIEIQQGYRAEMDKIQQHIKEMLGKMYDNLDHLSHRIAESLFQLDEQYTRQMSCEIQDIKKFYEEAIQCNHMINRLMDGLRVAYDRALVE